MSEKKWLVIWADPRADRPVIFEFNTRKEALAKAQKMNHQLAGYAAVTVVREEKP